MAATNLGQLSVDIVANIGNLQRGLNNATQLINRFAKQASRGAQTLGTGFQKTSQQVQTGAKFMGSQYNKFAVGVKESSAKVAKAVGTVDAPIRKAAEGIQKVGGSMKKTKPKMQEFEGGITGIIGGMGKWIKFNLTWFATWRLMWLALGWIKAGAAAIVEFDTAITNLGAVTGATQEQLLKLEDTAREVGATTRFTAVETATAMVDLSKAGFSVSEVNEMIAGTAQLAIGTLSELTQATQLVATTLRTFSLQAADATMVANIFAAAITNSRLTIESLRNSMKYIGPIMAEIGYSLEDTSAVLGVLADRGLEAGISARGLRGFFSALIAPSVKLRKELNRVGLSIHDVSPLTNDLATILLRLREAGFDVESAMRGLERRVGTIAVALISAGEYFDVLKDAITATTAAEVISERQTGSLGYQIKLIKSAATEVALNFRDLLLPSIKGVMGGITTLLHIMGGLLTGFVELLDILPPLARQFTILAGAIGLVTLAIGPAKLLGGLSAVLFLFGPIGLIIAGVVAALTGLVLWFKRAREETSKVRIEIAGSVFDLNKQRTELARTAIALQEYKDDQIKLRTALEGLADSYPEIRTLLMNENITYEDAIKIVNELIELKTEEARVRKEELIAAIDAEIEAHTREIEKVEELAQRIKDAFPIWKQLLQIWHWIWHGTFDSIKAIEEYEDKIKALERTRRQLMPTLKEAGEQEIFYADRIRMLAKDRLEMAKKQGKAAKELLPLYDEVIKAQREEAVVAEMAVKAQLEALMKREQAQISLADAIEDEEGEVKKAYDNWIKLEKELATLQMERGKIIDDYYKTLDDLRKAETELYLIEHKRRRTEEQWYEDVIDLARAKMLLLEQDAEREKRWTKENALEYINTQKKAFEMFTKLLDLRLQASLIAGLKEEQAVKSQQIIFEKWYPLFKNFATNYYKMTQDVEKYDEKLAEELRESMGTLGIEFETVFIKPTLLRELFLADVNKRVLKAYQEYNMAMLEFDISVGRERREVLIADMEALLADTEYWDGKQYAAKLALEKTIVGLYQATNKEIINEAKATAKTDLALALETLRKRRQYLHEMAAEYPILAEEITDAMEALIPGMEEINKALKESEDELFEMRVDTSEEVIALAAKETEEKIANWKKELENLKALEQAGIDVSERRLKITQILANQEAIADEERLSKKLELEETYLEQYVITAKAGLRKVTISSEENYQEALLSEEERYKDGLRALDAAGKENVMIFENSAELRERITTIHNQNTEKINEAHRQYELKEERRVEDEMMSYRRQINEATIQDEIAMLQKWLDSYILTQEERLAILIRINNLEKKIAEENYATWMALHDLRVGLAQDTLEGLELEAERRLTILHYLELIGATEAEIARARLSFYQASIEVEKEWIRLAEKRGLTNVEIEAEMRALWMSHYKDLFKTEEEASAAWEEHWQELLETMGLVSETIEGRWDLLVKRLTNRLKEWLRDSKGYLNDWALFVTEMFKFTIDKLADAFAELFQFIWEGQERIAMLERDRMADRLGDIERMLEREAEAHGKFTDRYKELLEMRGEAEKDLAESEFDLLKQRTAWWRNFINSLIAEIGRLIAYLLAKAVVITILRFLGIPVPAFAKGGEVKKIGSQIPELGKGGLIPSVSKRLQSLQKGGEVIVKAHEGEYYIPSPLVKQIKKTGEVPESLTEAIVAGKPPSFQRGGEVGVGEEGVGNLIVNFYPGTQFTEENKVKTRMWFEETILPLYREAERRE